MAAVAQHRRQVVPKPPSSAFGFNPARPEPAPYRALFTGLSLGIGSFLLPMLTRGEPPDARPGGSGLDGAWMIVLGNILAAFLPSLARAALHFIFIGGFGLLAFAVSSHVVLSHEGRPEEVKRSPWTRIPPASNSG